VLSCHDDQRAIDALIPLCQDVDQDIRQWAVFALGSQTDMDTPGLREALVTVLDDTDHEIRGEALVGLARRQDPRAFQAILNEWNSAGISILSVEAAEALADPNFIPYLKELYGSLDLAEDRYFQESIMNAILACERSIRK
ncbi:MAG: lyase, partial [Candidatus Electrothrix sp. ATG1]|nr:lyase [Candidatus Electrothrix sp. ATG1]